MAARSWIYKKEATSGNSVARAMSRGCMWVRYQCELMRSVGAHTTARLDKWTLDSRPGCKDETSWFLFFGSCHHGCGEDLLLSSTDPSSAIVRH